MVIANFKRCCVICQELFLHSPFVDADVRGISCNTSRTILNFFHDSILTEGKIRESTTTSSLSTRCR
nr:MAG TPA: hypothetical protein [Caudoviricetes sp.]